MPRNRVEWKIGQEVWRLGERTLVCGVIEAWPPPERGVRTYEEPDRAFVRAHELVDAGADFIEIAAERYSPGIALLSEAEELRRLVPILKRLRGKLPVPVSVQTWKPAVAEKAIGYGARIIRDPSGLTLDQDLGRIVLRHDAALVLQHMRGTPDKWARLGAWKNPVSLVAAELTAALNRANRLGIERTRLAIDPGFGMGKRKETNTELLAALDEFQRMRLPVCVSPDGQPFDAEIRVEPSPMTAAAVTALCIVRGAHIVRTTDPASLRPVALVADGLLRAEPEQR
ncbi:MAG: dihydropteroate synthase [Bryobacteraceae bacterium]|nr:MAG: dihydropteroate synthase [Bryobacteraceae bacterium]